MATITCEFCNEEIKGVINYSKHLQKKHKTESYRQGRRLKESKDNNEIPAINNYIN